MPRRVKGLHRALLDAESAESMEKRQLVGRLPVLQGPEGIAFESPRSLWILVIGFCCLLTGLQYLGEEFPRNYSSAIVFFSPFVVVSLLLLAFYFAGREIVTISRSELTVQRECLGLHWTRRFEMRHVHSLRFRTKSLWSSRPGLLAFDYGGMPRLFAWGIRKNEAVDLLLLIRRQFPSLRPAALVEELAEE